MTQFIYYQYVLKRDSAMSYSVTEWCDITVYRQTFINIYKLFRSTGSVDVRKRKCKNPMTKEDNEINILAAIAVNPHVSTRKIARQAGMSQSKNSIFQNQINFC
ncbi:uncharacterized protein LOC114880973 isoform X1 [Osmia bicornis bicornis]|uniref:uncharacterized protein LOC114880973 isoform X1 n=1 Tax=Osmia bicornis bicornis TaxID=1437191 RepID=UPI0010F9B774|nr:uncharacterized protein LOC114880973 isoform X1 [Osmia bicornis bicornis]